MVQLIHHNIEPISIVNTIYCNNGNGYFSPLRRHRIINTWSILINQVSKLLWLNFLLHAVFTFGQWLIVLRVLEWVRTRESGSESESTRSESESESESIRPESESIRCESESIGPESESESESIRPESESESESSGSESESESVSPTEVRVSPDLSPDSAWTHESNNRKVLYFNPSFNHFCWALYW